MIKKNRRPGRLPLTLKILSCIIGYLLWHIASQDQTITITRTVPLCFETANPQLSITCPEEVSITLQAKRSDLSLIDSNALAAHINPAQLQPGQHSVPLNSSQLFLPRSILLVHYDPCPIIVEIIKENNPLQDQQGVNS